MSKLSELRRVVLAGLRKAQRAMLLYTIGCRVGRACAQYERVRREEWAQHFREEIMRLMPDVVRWDWMEERKPTLLCICKFDGEALVGYYWELNDEFIGETAREAIDKAMHAEAVRASHFTCPKCGRTSYNESDIKQRYCGACHEFFPE